MIKITYPTTCVGPGLRMHHAAAPLSNRTIELRGGALRKSKPSVSNEEMVYIIINDHQWGVVQGR